MAATTNRWFKGSRDRRVVIPNQIINKNQDEKLIDGNNIVELSKNKEKLIFI